jgi:flavin-dependent dehydrogenase
VSPALDVLVIGGGPAGAVTALELARAGHTVRLIERGDYTDLRIGETLAPPGYAILGELGLTEAFEAQSHGRSKLIRSVWEDEELREIDYADDPLGPWWHLDRRRFDTLLVDAAERAGAVVDRRARVRGLVREAGWWRATLVHDEDAIALEARFVVDATGRASSIARSAGATRIAHDELVGLVGIPTSLEDREFYTMTEVTDDGWWYSALLPGERYVAIFMTDADLVPKGRAPLSAFWRTNLDKAKHTQSRLTNASLPPEARAVSANSAMLEPSFGDGWIAVGDASLSFDPISGAGIWHALDSARRAAYAVSADLAREQGALEEYAVEEREAFASYLEAHVARYQRVRRWPAAPFWRRRHAIAMPV